MQVQFYFILKFKNLELLFTSVINLLIRFTLLINCLLNQLFCNESLITVIIMIIIYNPENYFFVRDRSRYTTKFKENISVLKFTNCKINLFLTSLFVCLRFIIFSFHVNLPEYLNSIQLYVFWYQVLSVTSYANYCCGTNTNISSLYIHFFSSHRSFIAV